jgi:KH domain
VIGRNGTNLAKLCQEHKIKIDVREPNDTKVGECRVSGRRTSCEAVKAKLLKLAEQAGIATLSGASGTSDESAIHKETLLIPSSDVGLILGKGREGLASLMKNFDLTISVSDPSEDGSVNFVIFGDVTKADAIGNCVKDIKVLYHHNFRPGCEFLEASLSRARCLNLSSRTLRHSLLCYSQYARDSSQEGSRSQ